MVRTILLLSLCAAPLVAQPRGSVTLGDRVRILAPKAGYGQITGRVVATTPDVLSIAIDKTVTEVAVPRERIDRLFLSIGSKRHVGPVAFLGAALGVGLALGFGPRERTVPGSTIEAGRGSKKNLITGAIGGAAVGALIGYGLRKDTWIERSPMARFP